MLGREERKGFKNWFINIIIVSIWKGNQKEFPKYGST